MKWITVHHTCTNRPITINVDYVWSVHPDPDNPEGAAISPAGDPGGCYTVIETYDEVMAMIRAPEPQS